MNETYGNTGKNYSALYKVYRRMRYLRYLRRNRKNLKRQQKKAESEERKKVLEVNRAQRRKELLDDREKSRKEREIRSKERRSEMTRARQALEEYRPLIEARRDKEKNKQERELAFQKQRRKRLLRFYIKNLFRKAGLWIKSINRENLKRKIRHYREREELRRILISITLNSTSLFLLSYLFIYIFSLIITSVSATFFEYSSIIYYYDIYFNIRGDQWHHDSVKVIYSSGPVGCLFVGTIMLIIFSYIREEKGLYKMFFFWGFLHSFTMFFGGLLVGTIFGTGLGHVINWSYVLDTGKMVYSIIAIAVLILIGLLSTRSLLISANSYFNDLTGKIRGKFVFAQMIMPFIAGNLMMFLFRMPRLKMYYIFVALTMILILLPAWISSRYYPNMYFHEDPVNVRPSWKLIVLAMIVFAVLRFLLDVGIPVDFT